MLDSYMIDKIEDNLRLGLDIEIHNIVIKNYSIKELKTNPLLKNYMIETSISTKNIDDYYGRGFSKNNPDISLVDICFIDEKIKNIYIRFLCAITGENWKFICCPEFYVFISIESETKLYKSEMEDILFAFNKVYCRERYDPYEKYGNYDMADDETKRVIDQLIKDEANEYSKPTMTLSSMAEGVAYSKFSGLNIFNVWDLKIYQLHNAVKNILIQEEQELTSGIISNGCATKELKYDRMKQFKIN